MSADALKLGDVVTSDLPSKVEETVAACPKFRILLVGNSGVGKSSLVASIFNISSKDIDIADGHPGRADITYEYKSNKNERFILHDSEGFEPGSVGNSDKVEVFLRRRSAKAIKDRVHAVWLCVLAPLKGARLLQAGDEKIIALAQELGIPVIVVFTQYDRLVDEQKMYAAIAGNIISEDEAARKADAAFNDRIKGIAETKTAIVKVSTSIKYSRRLATQEELTVVTWRCLGVTASASVTLENPTSNEKRIQEAERQMNDGIALVFTLAQQINATQKVEVSISEGFKKYWGNLGKSAFFEGHTMTQCVFRVHDDIRTVWNCYDPDKLLSGEDFFTQMNKLVSSIMIGDVAEEVPQNDSVDRFRGALAAVGPAMATSPHLLIAFGIVGIGYVVFKFLYEQYQKLPSAAKYLGAYIVDLTCILHRIFVETPHTDPPTPVSQDLISRVIEQYTREDSFRVHQRVSGMNFMHDYKKKLEDLIYETISPPRFTSPHDDTHNASVPQVSQSDPLVPLDVGHNPTPGPGSNPNTTKHSKGRKKSDGRQSEQKDKTSCIIA